MPQLPHAREQRLVWMAMNTQIPKVVDLLRRVNQTRGIAFLIVTHDERIARRCDRVVHLVDGRIVSDGPPTPGLDS
jgi:predicted ABC-type transport system involved in lysophospholipase L1 biosynthesis ATPase subunit